jgi:hypothetical protein
LWAYGTATTEEILDWCYETPAETRRTLRHRQQAVWHAAKELAIAIDRSPTGKGRPVIWRLTAGTRKGKAAKEKPRVRERG